MKLIFDIGTNVGQSINDFLNKYGQSCNIISVEANPALVTQLNGTFPDNIKILNYAVSSEDNIELNFHINVYGSGISTASDEWMTQSRFAAGGGWTQVIHIKTITLDTLIKQYGLPDFIKIDVEGYELEVLKGLSQKVGLVSFEWTEELFPTTQKCVDRLKEIGFTEFAYTLCEDVDSIPQNFTKWEDSNIHNVDKSGKIKYGMIYAK